MTQGDRDLIERGRTLASQSIDGNLRGPALQMADRLQALSADNEKLREALSTCDDAIREYSRYFYGGEMRGSYDGKPERAQLQKAGHAATQALKGTGANNG